MVVDELNASIGRPLGWRVELYGWEDTPIGAVRPQSQINEEVNQCDLFVGLLWERWGQPPGESPYNSGFEEEIELAKARRAKTGSPEIWLFLKKIDPKLLRDPGEQMKLVIAFREKTRSEQKLFYKEFDNSIEWTSEFRRRLSNYLVTLAGTRSFPATASTPPERTESTTELLELEAQTREDLPKSSQQAIGLISTLSRAISAGALETSQVKQIEDKQLARILLLAGALQASYFKDELLTAHQANLIYRERDGINPSKSERLLLLRTMLASSEQNVPGWAWFRSDKTAKAIVAIATYDTSDEVSVGAIRFLRELKLGISPQEKKKLLETLLGRKSENCSLQAALWLQSHGELSDLPFLLECKLDDSSELSIAAENASLAILQRDNPIQALKELSETSQKPSEGIATSILAFAQDADLHTFLKHSNPTLRKLSALELHERSLLTGEMAAALIKDINNDVQITGIELSIQLGEFIPSSQIRSVVRPTSLLAAIGSTSSPDADRIIVKSLETLSPDELKKKIDWYLSDGYLAYAALARKYFSSFHDQIISDLSDGFSSLQKKCSERLLKEFGEAGRRQLDQYDGKLNNFLRKQYTAAALDAIATYGSSIDRPVVEEFIKTADFDTAGSLGEFLGKHGGAEDAKTIIDLYKKSWSNRDHLLNSALQLMQDPHSLLSDSTIDEQTLAKIIRLLDNASISAGQNSWLSLLSSSSSDVRKAIAYRIYATSDSKKRRRLLTSLLSMPSYYYDAVYWLDRMSYAPIEWQSHFADSLQKHLDQPFKKDWLD